MDDVVDFAAYFSIKLPFYLSDALSYLLIPTTYSIHHPFIYLQPTDSTTIRQHININHLVQRTRPTTNKTPNNTMTDDTRRHWHGAPGARHEHHNVWTHGGSKGPAVRAPWALTPEMTAAANARRVRSQPSLPQSPSPSPRLTSTNQMNTGLRHLHHLLNQRQRYLPHFHHQHQQHQQQLPAHGQRAPPLEQRLR